MNSFIAIDSLRVDERVRITLTKEVRRVLDIRPGDTIAILQNRFSNEIILKIQRDGIVANTFLVKKEGKSGKSALADKVPQKNSKTRILNAIKDNPIYRYRPQIIIIDDDNAALLTFQSYLQTEGFGVQTFSNSTDAVEFLEAHHEDYTLVISDIRMPETNGLKLYKKLKSINKDIRIMFVTALDIIDEVLSILPDLNEKYIMKKPIKREQFLTRVNSIICDTY